MKTSLSLVICLITTFSLSAQTIYFEENFDNCSLPLDWETEEEFESKGWIVGTSSFMSSEILPYPDNDGNCFLGNSDAKWDDETGDLNNANSDKVLFPYIDFSDSENLVLSFDYISGYKGGVKIFFRTENSGWTSVGNGYTQGGILEWQEKHIHVFGHVNAPIKDVSEPIQFMFEFTDHGFSRLLGVGVDNIKIYEAPKYDIALHDVHLPVVVPVGTFPIKPGFSNRGSEFISTVEFSWQIDDGPIESQVISEFVIDKDFAIWQLYPFGLGTIPSPDLLVTFPEEGAFTFKVWMNLSGNLVDENLEDNYWEREVIVKNELPEKHYVYEKFSHHTCSPCYQADQLAKEIEDTYENVHVVSVHSASSDPMDYPLADVVDIAYSQRTHPGTIMDRRFMGMYENGKMSSLYEFLPDLTSPWFSPVDIAFTSKEVTSTAITLEVQAEFVAPVDGEFRFNIWTLENGIVNYQAGAPQGNNYIHNHVLREYTGGNYGAEGSLPEQIEANKKYTYTAVIDINPQWNIDSLEFLAIIQQYTPDSDNRDIVNASKISVNETIIVANKEESLLDFNVYPNPSNQFIHIVLDEQTDANFSISIYDITGNLINQATYSEHAQNYIQYDISGYAAGNYLVVLQSEKGKQMKQFSVVK